MVSEEDYCTKLCTVGDCCVQPDASHDSDVPFFQGFPRQGQRWEHSRTRDSCGQGGFRPAWGGANLEGSHQGEPGANWYRGPFGLFHS